MNFPDPQQFLADHLPPQQKAVPDYAAAKDDGELAAEPTVSGAADLGPAEPPHAMDPAMDLEDWALASLYTCEQCMATLRPERMLRYCPRCGHRLATGPIAADEAVSKFARIAEPDGAEPDGTELDVAKPDVLSPDNTTTDPVFGPIEPCLTDADVRDIAANIAVAHDLSSVSRADVLAIIGYWQSVLEVLPADAPTDDTAEVTTQFEAAMRGENVPLPFAGVYQPSAIVTAYASALYRLGRAYEMRLGTEHNEAEAARCFFKAARLGNPDAINRISARQTGVPGTDRFHA